MRFITGLLSLKIILLGVALWFVLSTMGTLWTVLIAYGLVVFALFKWGPDKETDNMTGFVFRPTRGRAYALIAPLVVMFLFPLAIISAVTHGTLDEER